MISTTVRSQNYSLLSLHRLANKSSRKQMTITKRIVTCLQLNPNDPNDDLNDHPKPPNDHLSCSSLLRTCEIARGGTSQSQPPFERLGPWHRLFRLNCNGCGGVTARSGRQNILGWQARTHLTDKGRKSLAWGALRAPLLGRLANLQPSLAPAGRSM